MNKREMIEEIIKDSKDLNVIAYELKDIIHRLMDNMESMSEFHSKLLKKLEELDE